MRPDVKLGVVLAAAIVFVAGSYYLYRDRSEKAIPVATGLSGLADATGKDASTARPANAGPVTDAKTSKRQNAVRPKLTTTSGVKSKATDGPRQVAHRPDAESRRRATPRRAANRIPKKPARTVDVALGEKKNASARDAKDGSSAAQPASKLPITGDKQRSPAMARGSKAHRTTSVAKREARPAVRPGALADRANPAERRSVPLAALGRKSAQLQRTGKIVAADETHRIQPGDTLGELAKRYYGSARHVEVLLKANPQIKDPRALRVGDVLKIPALPTNSGGAITVPQPQVRSATGAGKRTYRIQPGDSFYKIARDVLGDASRWKELFELNRGAVKGDPKLLQVGQVIVLPVR